MSVDRTKALESAQKHLGKGNYDRAIGELKKIVQADPSDIRTWLKIGDLYTRSGARGEAIATYGRVAKQYGEQGFFLKAVAVYKQILKLDPSRLDEQVSLAEMYEMLQLVSDALSTYEHVASAFARAGRMDDALAMLSKMTALDPENIPVRIKAAEALSKAGRPKDAAVEFEAGAALLKSHGRMDDYIKVAERLLYHRPEDIALARELAKLYLDRDDPKRALSKLQLCFKADPKHIATLELLAEAFRQLGQLPKTVSVLKEVARIHQEAGRHEERAQILRRILELDPGEQEARQGLAGYADQRPSVPPDIAPPASAVVDSSRREPLPEEDDDLDVELLEDAEVLIVDDDDDLEMYEDDEVMEAVAAAPERQPSVPPDVQREAQIARLLTECDVFLRYGLKQKVIEQLHSVLEIDPMHVEARERLKDLLLEEGRVEEAVSELITLADILDDVESPAASLYLRQALELEPGNSQALSRLEARGSIAPPAADTGPPTESAADEIPVETDLRGTDLGEDDLREEGDEDVFFVEEDPADVTSLHPVLPMEEMHESSPLTLVEDDELVEVTSGAVDVPRTDVHDALVEEPPSRQAIVPPPSATGTASGSLRVPGPRRLGDPLAPMSPEEFDEVPLRPSTPGEVVAEASQRLSTPPGDVEELLDEADFFIAQGLVEEARARLAEAGSNYPKHPLIADKLRDVSLLAESAAATRASMELEINDQSFELAEKLAEEFEEVEDTEAGSDVLDVEQVFAQFKKGVSAQVAVEDTETHFDLGIAYKEMGLLDDAISEFELCLVNVQRTCIAETMIGLCHIEKGGIADAIGHFKKGLYADNKSDREELGLYFELGRAYELLHDPKEALYYYQKVHKREPAFRDVEGRIDGLSRPSAPEPTPPEMGQDDIDAAFDDLMGED